VWGIGYMHGPPSYTFPSPLASGYNLLSLCASRVSIMSYTSTTVRPSSCFSWHCNIMGQRGMYEDFDYTAKDYVSKIDQDIHDEERIASAAILPKEIAGYGHVAPLED
jgi:hypothetical protein